MSFDNIVIELKNIEKNYKIYKKPIFRLFQMFPWNKNKKFYNDFYALKNIDLSVQKGEVLGLVGQNGAGKSTLLQIICKTLQASSGQMFVKGRITALLELGSGFNPEFTGSENIYLAGAIAGLSKKEIENKYDSIIEFSGIANHIHNPVKTYSSGMLVRLAFSVATSVEPDILVIDEALSVGDGAFAKKSFDRIMQLKNRGCTILFCSHNTYQIEVFCDKAIWLKNGNIEEFGKPAIVVDRYQKFLDSLESTEPITEKNQNKSQVYSGINRILKVELFKNNKREEVLKLESEKDDLLLKIYYKIDINMKTPTIAVVITDTNMRNISSSLTRNDDIAIPYDNSGKGSIKLNYPKLSLLRGEYLIHVLLMCENAIHIYESVQCATLEMTQKNSSVGVVSLNRQWIHNEN